MFLLWGFLFLMLPKERGRQVNCLTVNQTVPIIFHKYSVAIVYALEI
jgi:hypothetical protein